MMKRGLFLALVSVMLITLVVGSTGCKSYHRSRTVWFGDHNVTVVKKPKRAKVAGRRKAVTSRTYNHSVRKPGR